MNLVKDKSKKPVYLYTDDASIRRILEDKNKSANQMATALVEVQNLIQRKLTQLEKKTVLMDRWPGVLKLTRDNVGFPKADETALFGLLGVNSTNCKRAVESIKTAFYDDQFEISDNDVHVSPKFIKETEKANTYFTKSERQNEALKIAQDLSKVLNAAKDNGLISKMDHPANVSLNHGHDWKSPLKTLVTITNGTVVPNVEEIARLK